MNKFIIVFGILFFFNCKENKAKDIPVEVIVKDSMIEKKGNNNVDNRIIHKDTIETVLNLKGNRRLKDYKNNITQVKSLLDKDSIIGNNAIESIIPSNSDEFSFYYDLTYSTEEDWNLFEKINSLIVEKAQSDVGNCLSKYSNLAEFVDGEYAEGFYADILFIAQSNSNKFCDVFSNLSSGSKENLLDIHNEICKK